MISNLIIIDNNFLDRAGISEGKGKLLMYVSFTPLNLRSKTSNWLQLRYYDKLFCVQPPQITLHLAKQVMRIYPMDTFQKCAVREVGCESKNLIINNFVSSVRNDPCTRVAYNANNKNC